MSLIAAYLLHFIPDDWLIGLLGVIPIYLGVHYVMSDTEEPKKEDLLERIETQNSQWLLWTVTFITLASGGDNLGIYIPYFTSLTSQEILIVILVFSGSISVLCYVCERLAHISFIAVILEKCEKFIVPLVFVGLGIYILYKNGTLSFLYYLIR